MKRDVAFVALFIAVAAVLGTFMYAAATRPRAPLPEINPEPTSAGTSQVP